MTAGPFYLQATRVGKDIDIRERFVWYAGPGRLSCDTNDAVKLATIADVQMVARAIDARGGWKGYCNVAAVHV